MNLLSTLALAMCASWVSGINLYASVATLGLLGRYAERPEVPLQASGAMKQGGHPWPHEPRFGGQALEETSIQRRAWYGAALSLPTSTAARCGGLSVSHPPPRAL